MLGYSEALFSRWMKQVWLFMLRRPACSVNLTLHGAVAVIAGGIAT